MAERKKKETADAVKEKSDKSKELKDKLFAQYKNLWEVAGADDVEHAFAFSEEYMRMLDIGKTEREFVVAAVESLEELGYVEIGSQEKLAPGSKVYASIRGKGLMAAVVGKKPLSEGFNILGAHIDSPRIDLKPCPVYEDGDMVFFKTHYYGGIKKYQWTAIPLAIHGVAFREDGSRVTLCIGEDPDDPVFTFSDILPHLGQEQMARKSADIVKGEELNLMVGSIPYEDPDAASRFKLGFLNLLFEQYGLKEKDLVTAEIQIVPAFRARDVGLDRSCIGAYGHDDRVCAFPALVAVTDQEKPQRTAVCMLSDKEEIGSVGNTGAHSRLYENFLAEVYAKTEGGYDELGFAKALENTRLLSADVCNGYDPTFSSVSDPRNNAYIGRGICLEKYTGSRGKSGASDSNAEFFSSVVRLFAKGNIPWQTGELGKVDAGGGGTIAYIMANKGMEVLDCGVAVLSMHAPFEVISKIDLYYTYLAYKCFVENA
ncbi:MAG: aminopeptidase [Clostridia bacterium]|nr:aminopeptidase [Clostridia bacterium]